MAVGFQRPEDWAGIQRICASVLCNKSEADISFVSETSTITVTDPVARMAKSRDYLVLQPFPSISLVHK